MATESGGDADGLGGSCARAGYTNGVDVNHEVTASSTCGALIDDGPFALSAGSNVGVPGVLPACLLMLLLFTVCFCCLLVYYSGCFPPAIA